MSTAEVDEHFTLGPGWQRGRIPGYECMHRDSRGRRDCRRPLEFHHAHYYDGACEEHGFAMGAIVRKSSPPGPIGECARCRGVGVGRLRATAESPEIARIAAVGVGDTFKLVTVCQSCMSALLVAIERAELASRDQFQAGASAESANSWLVATVREVLCSRI